MSQSDIVITAEGIGKRYRRGRKLRYKSLRDSLAGVFKAPLRGADPPEEDFWALRNVSFQIKRGEIVGMIGRNGAGKSTLLKILSKITAPTTGEIRICGRVGSLLEVGTGFHSELSGRENIYLNGAILGMKRQEIARKFEEIVSFAEVEEFLDLPVKHYSSGMYMRLAFSVAAHLESEILLVDEVLAVGDAQFQKKCLGKMSQVASSGRTVLFVSHQAAAVQGLCSHGILLDRGEVMHVGPIGEVFGRYAALQSGTSRTPLSERVDRSGTGAIRVGSVGVHDANAGDLDRRTCRLRFSMDYAGEKGVDHVRVAIGVCDERGIGVLLLDSEASGQEGMTLPRQGQIVCEAAEISLLPGRYYINIAIFGGGSALDYVLHAAEFEVESYDFYGTGRLPSSGQAICLVAQEWRVD